MTPPVELPKALGAIAYATAPEYLFGREGTEEAVAAAFRAWAKAVHEDVVPEPMKTAAKEAFLRLQTFRERALAKIAAGTYGDGRPDVVATIISGKTSYPIADRRFRGDLSDLYPTGDSLLLKLARDPSVNDLLSNEARTLSALAKAIPEPYRKLVPDLVDSFSIGVGKTRRAANVIREFSGGVRLSFVVRTFPNLDGRDAAWMLNRLLDSLVVVSDAGFVHGAICPCHFLIQPKTHRGLLVDWCYSVKAGETVKALPNIARPYAAPEILAKHPATPSTDVFAAGGVLLRLFGGDPATGASPRPIPRRIAGLIRACRIPNPSRRIQTAEELHGDLASDLLAIYGPRTFREFEIPPENPPAETKPKN